MLQEETQLSSSEEVIFSSLDVVVVVTVEYPIQPAHYLTVRKDLTARNCVTVMAIRYDCCSVA